MASKGKNGSKKKKQTNNKKKMEKATLVPEKETVDEKEIKKNTKNTENEKTINSKKNTVKNKETQKKEVEEINEEKPENKEKENNKPIEENKESKESNKNKKADESKKKKKTGANVEKAELKKETSEKKVSSAETEKETENKKDKSNKDSEEIKTKKDFSNKKNIKKKRNWYTIIFVFIVIVLAVFFSTIFALINMNHSNIAKGVKIKNIDVSGLTVEEAKTRLEKALNIELLQDLNLKYEDKYETNLESNEIEFIYDVEKAIEDAFKFGRNGNIIQNNYCLLYATFFEKNIDIDYTYNEEFLNSFVEDVESKLPGVVTQVTYYMENDQLIINKGTDGIGIDVKKFKKEILENIYNRDAEKIIANTENEKLDIPIVKKKADKIDIEKIYNEIYTEPKDAYYELEPFNIYPEVNGVDLEIGVEEAKKQIESEDKEEYIFALKITPAEKTIKSFGIEAFPNLVSSFSTKYDASNINRSKNLEIAAGKINGLVLMPGEVFSFNTVVGKRTVEEGYRDAKIYADGGVVDGLAGGICQISSTLYNAVLLANLEIVERRNHSFTTSYVPAGRDATVVYGTIDFQFKNSRTYPIKIEATVSKGTATFNIHSVALEENEYEIKIRPVVTQSIPYTTEQVPDPTLMPGQQVVVQAGHSGYRVTTYKEIWQNGALISSDVLSNDVYKPMRAIVRIGP